MRKLLLVVATLALAACASETTAPSARKAPAAASRDLVCRSGYVVAYDDNGDAYCAPDGRMVVRKP